MKFDMKTPCPDCPFRHDNNMILRPERAEEIAYSLAHGNTFPCHKTVEYEDEDDGRETEDSQMCAGAMIMLMHYDGPNNIMRIMHRLGQLDLDALDLDAPVFIEIDDFIDEKGVA